MKKLKIYSWLVLILISGLTLFAMDFVKDLRFNYNIESFFSNSDPELKYYLDHRKTFENDNDFILVGIKNSPSVLDQKFLLKVDSLSKTLAEFPRILKVVSPTNYSKTAISPFGIPFSIPLIHLNEPLKYSQDITKALTSQGIESSMFSNDSTCLQLYLKKEELTSKSINDSLLNAIETLIGGFDFEEFHLAGRIKTQNYYVTKMNSEMMLFALISILLLIAFLVFSFRCVCGVLVPVMVLIVSVIWSFAIIQIGSGEMDLMMTMLPTLLFVIGISTSVHMLSHYIDELAKDNDKGRSIIATIKEMGVTTFLTSFTTSLGFASLMFIDIEPIQKFGMYAAIGIILTYIVSILLLPAMLILLRDPKMTCSLKLQGGWNKILFGILNISLNKKKIVYSLTLLIILLSSVGIYKLENNNHFLDDLSSKSSLKNDLNFFESNFSGIRPIEIGVRSLDTTQTLLSLEGLKEIDSMETYLKTNYGVKSLVGPATIIKTAFQSYKSGSAENYRLPKNQKELKKLIKFMKKRKILKKVENLLTIDKKRGRISGMISDLGSKKIMEQNLALNTFCGNFTHVEFTVTGAAHLMDNANSRIASNLIEGLLLGFLVVTLIIALLFRSIKIALLSLIPNLLPLLIIGGVMGFAGVDLKVATALIFTITFGIAVDDTIHFLARVRMELKKGATMEKAVSESMKTTGKAIIITSFILSAGFLTFLFSDFGSTFYIGLLVSLTLFLALLADLFLLPGLLLKKNR